MYFIRNWFVHSLNLNTVLHAASLVRFGNWSLPLDLLKSQTIVHIQVTLCFMITNQKKSFENKQFLCQFLGIKFTVVYIHNVTKNQLLYVQYMAIIEVIQPVPLGSHTFYVG